MDRKDNQIVMHLLKQPFAERKDKLFVLISEKMQYRTAGTAVKILFI